MKRKAVQRVYHRKTRVVAARKASKPASWIIWIRGWMFLVMFALMLGVGALFGSFLNQQITAALSSPPIVAGASTSR